MGHVVDADIDDINFLYDGDAPLSSPSGVSIDYFAPPHDLTPFITTLYYFRCDDMRLHDMQPADVGNLMMVLRGRGAAHFRDGRIEDVPRCALLSPASVATPFRFVGGMHTIGAALTPRGWAALSGKSAKEYGNRAFDAEEHICDSAGPLWQSLGDSYESGAFDPAELAGKLARFIASKLKPVPQRHVELIDATVAWLGTSLDPDLDRLYEASSYSKRQTQRLVEQYFGISPRALKRKYRAVRAAAILSSPDCGDDRIAAVEEHFYDQSHLIREIGMFVGRTPSRLGGVESPILNELLDPNNFRIIMPEGGGDWT